MADQETISVPEMARQLGVTTASIYNYIERGIIRGKRVRRGLRERIVVLRVDFEAALPNLTGDVDAGEAKADSSYNPNEPRSSGLVAA